MGKESPGKVGRTGLGNFICDRSFYVIRSEMRFPFQFTELVVQTPSRSYAVSVKLPKIFAEKPIPRRYPENKAFLYHRYMRLLETSSSSTLIFLLHSDFAAQRLAKLRKDIIVASGHVAPSLAAISPNPVSSSPSTYPTLTVLQTSVFGAALRDFTSLGMNETEHIANAVKGPLAVLSLPELDPPQLNAVLRALERGVPPKRSKTKEELELERQEKSADPATPGRRVKKVKPTLEPELKVIGAIIERKLFTSEGLRGVSTMPTLGTLRSQIVQLLSYPGSQLAVILSEAGGRRLSRTLEGLKKGLEEIHPTDSRTP